MKSITVVGIEKEVEAYRESYQATFFGFNCDIILEISNDEQLYYVIFRAGECIQQEPPFFLSEANHILVVYARGNIYRFDIIDRKCMAIDCYGDVLFSNNQNYYNISPYFSAATLTGLYVMAVIDSEGIAVITCSNVLWKRKFDWEYPNYVQILSISKSLIIIEYYLPYEGSKLIALDTMTGQFCSNSA
ncbi:hypothetical protein [Candidatus Trichorickettsia mobilis]|uniref:hypothetical protein n=1 Tax=Candidatus Trichorickettsia mobilis TaxID=1346319 RepID=UPI002930FF28|nr:hypothetical protein [Candidatus Trichorickettsia mobilis]